MTAAAILTPGIGVAMIYHTLRRIACTLVKDITYTSQVLTGLATEMTQIREATLENQAAIDYLLLRHGHGCEEGGVLIFLIIYNWWKKRYSN